MNNNDPSSHHFLRWFDPRHKSIGTIAFIINRFSALGLTVYLILHLVVLSKLASGGQAYDEFLILAKSPVIKIGEMFVIAGGIIHGANGVRIALNSFGFLVKIQKELFIGLMILSLAIIFYFGVHMFSGAQN
ncbi:MAG: hypothetical protein IT308_10210 [Anaerolineaceae bacterium]|nr:hypothetical protein [Anaerolineaceae bacterium]